MGLHKGALKRIANRVSVIASGMSLLERLQPVLEAASRLPTPTKANAISGIIRRIDELTDEAETAPEKALTELARIEQQAITSGWIQPLAPPTTSRARRSRGSNRER